VTLVSATPLGVRVHVPLRLGPLTTVGDETPPSDVGVRRKIVDHIWTAVEALYRTGLHPGISLVVRHRGAVVIDRAIGHRRMGEPELMTTDTPACLFSASKAISSLVIHKLAEQGALQLDDRIAEYLPKFAQNGKQDVTIRSLLTHRAGLYKLPFGTADPAQFFDHDAVVDALCAEPLKNANRQSYHAITGGYILGAVAEQVSGRDMRSLLRDITEPVGATTADYGVPPERRDAIALSYSTGPKRLPPFTTILKRLLGVPAHIIAPASNTPEALSSVVESAGIFASAHDAARIFGMLADGGQWEGRQVLAPESIAAAVEPAGPLVIDAMLPAPIRFSPGFMLGERVASLYGLDTPHAFGHLGFTNVVCWADPSRELAVALLNTGKAPSPEGFIAMAAVTAAISAGFTPTRHSS
jgi:CubicO group peptidase (beta-lactamase class C family)